MGEADEFVTSFMIADTVVSESSEDSFSSAGALVDFEGLAVCLRSCGCPIVRFTVRWVLPRGDGGLVACVARAFRGALVGVLKLCIGVPADVAGSSSETEEAARVREARSGDVCALLGARGCSLVVCEMRSMPWKSESTPWAMVRSETFTLLRVTA
jgi:hypothetical protein